MKTDPPNSAEGTKESSKKKGEKSREVAESPTFIRQMSHIIQGAGDATPKPAETEMPAQRKLPKEQGTPNMYIPDCENVATQSSPSKVCSDVRNVVQETVPSEATTYTINPRPIVNVDSNYVETHCQHGSKRPIHIHFRRKIQKPDGEVIRDPRGARKLCQMPSSEHSHIQRKEERKDDRHPSQGFKSLLISGVLKFK